MGLIEYDRYELSKKEKRDFIIIAYVCLFAGSYIFYHSIVLSLLSGVGLIFIKKIYVEYLAEKRRGVLGEQFKDLLYSLSSSFAAGRHMREALAEASENLKLVYEDDSPMVKELSYMVKSMESSKANEEELLRDFASRSHIEDIRNFMEVYFTCRATGASLEKVIAKASDILMDKLSIQKEIKMLTAQKQFEGKIISLMPVIVILILNLVSPEYLGVLYTTFTGRVIMSFALLGIGYAYYLTLALTKIEV